MMLDTTINYTSKNAEIVAEVIQQEIHARSKVTWKTNKENTTYSINLSINHSFDHEETYVVSQPSEKCFTIQGKTTRALLYGAGKFMRSLELTYKQDYDVPYQPVVRLSDDVTFPITSTPKYTWRGHQIAYRPKTHSYDATTVEQMKQEILDQVLFGCNTIEMIPPKLDDCNQSPHFMEPWTERLTTMSSWCDCLGVKTSLWYPAFPGADWHETFKAMKCLDILFVPGGDPGGRDPEELFRIVRQHVTVARQYFPDVEVWVSSQYGLAVSKDLNLVSWRPKEKLEGFYKQVEANQDLLTGLVYGPWTADTSQQFRERIPAHLPIRDYPDLCHNLKSQYPVGPRWDLPFAMTYYRETINPRPEYFAATFRHEMPWCQYGAGCYSEGCGDDVNKHVWSGMLWGEDDTRLIMEEYAHWYVGDTQAADLIFALEQNWLHPLKSGLVLKTLEQTLKVRAQLPCWVERNWRWQMIYFRAVCDAFLYQLQYGENKGSTSVAWPVPFRGRIVPWQTQDEEEKQTTYFTPSALALYGRLEASGALLYATAGMQLDISRYGSMHEERGGHLDLLCHLPPDDGVAKGKFKVLRLQELPTTGYTGPLLDYADISHPRVIKVATILPTRWLSFYSCIWPRALPLEIQIDVPEGGTQVEIVYIGEDLLFEGGDYEELEREAIPVRCLCNGILLHDYKTVEGKTQPSTYPIPSLPQQQLHLVWDVADRSEVTVRCVPIPVADVRILSSTGDKL